MDVVEDDWTSVVDDIDRYQLSEFGRQPVPPSQLHRGERSIASTVVSDTQTQEEVKGEKMSLVIHMVPAFGLKELSVYADPNQLI